MAIAENHQHESNHAAAIGLSALGWTLQDATRSERLLALTGLTVDDLRARADQPSLLVAILEFLENHEPDLVKCAEALNMDPKQLVNARMTLQTQNS